MTYTAMDRTGKKATLTFAIGVEGDVSPRFQATVENQMFLRDVRIQEINLPEATGGNGNLNYFLTMASVSAGQRPLPPDLWFIIRPNGRFIGGTPTGPDGIYPMRYIAEDADGDRATLEFEIAIEANTSPRFDTRSIGDKSYTVGTSISPVTLPAATGGNFEAEHGLVYGLVGDLPPGLRFDNSTRELSGTPTTPGRYDVTYRVEDVDPDHRAEDRDELTFVVTVDADDPSMRGMVWPTELTAVEPDWGAVVTLTYAVRLDREPSETVTIRHSVTKTGIVGTRGWVMGDGRVTVSPASLTFTAATWSDPQTVTIEVYASDYSDVADWGARISHSASGGGFDNVSIPSVTVTVTDPDTRYVIGLESDAVSVEEDAGHAEVRVVAVTELDQRPRYGWLFSLTTFTANEGDTATWQDLGVLSEAILIAPSEFEPFTPPGGTPVYRAVITRSVEIVDDAVQEDDETFSLKLQGMPASCFPANEWPYACQIDPERDEGIVTILANDGP